jgi:hypothetical protein
MADEDQGGIMVNKKLLDPKRIRKIQGSFSFLEHRFLRQGFFENLTQHELLLYLFLILTRDGLINTDLLAFDGFFFQILALPTHAVIRKQPLTSGQVTRGGESVHIFDILRRFPLDEGLQDG